MKRLGTLMLACFAVVPAWAEEFYRPEVSPDALKTSMRTHWYGVHINGKKIGNYKAQAIHTEEAILDANDMHMKITAQGKQTEVEVRKRVWFAAAKPHHILRAEEVHISPQGTEKLVLRPHDGKWRLEVTAGSRRFEKECSTPDYTYADVLAADDWIKKRPAVGAHMSYRSLNIASAKVSGETIRLLASKGSDADTIYEAVIQGGKDDLPVRARYDVHGTMLLGGAGPLEFQRETEAEAKKIAHGDDLFNLGFIHLDAPLGELNSSRVITLEVVGVENSAFDLGAHQRVAEGNRLILGRDKGVREKVTPEEAQRALEENIDFPLRDPRVKKLAAMAIGTETDPKAQAALLVGFVHGLMRSEATAENPNIDKLLDDPRGDCKAHARLFAVLARSANLPTREVTGLAYMGDAQKAYAGHRWNEIALDGVWTAVDAVPAAIDVRLTHIHVKNLNMILGKTSFKLACVE